MRAPMTLAFLALGPAGVAAVAASLAACGGGEPLTLLEPPPPGLRADPAWLTFTCIHAGCSSVLTSTLTVRGDRPIAVRRVALSRPDDAGFSVEPSRTLPVVLVPGERLSVRVRHEPTGAAARADLSIQIDYTDGASADAPNRIEPGSLDIPILRRAVGESRLSVEPSEIVFGAVPPGREAHASLRLRNAGFGNMGLVLFEVLVEPEDEVHLEAVPTSIGPASAVDVGVIWTPTSERVLRGNLRFLAGQEAPIPVVVPLLGTSIQRASLGVEPASGVDFGQVDVGERATARVEVTNLGIDDLLVSSMDLLDVPPEAELSLDWGTNGSTVTLSALRSLTAQLALEATAPGVLDARLRVRSSDPGQPTVEVPVTALLARPTISVVPLSIDWGAVPLGWARAVPVEISNAGRGALEVRGVDFVLGSSTVFTLRSRPDLPVELGHGERLRVEVEFRSEAAASFSGTLAIESNDPDQPFVDVALAGRGASCEEVCPIENGSPDCTSGACAIGSCDQGFHDVDDEPSNGCECREPDARGDPGGFCQDAIYLGSLDDDGEQTSFTGVLPSPGDVDILRFHARDSSELLSDGFDVRIELSSPDPAIEMCLYRYDTESHVAECFFENERCGIRTYRRDGSLGREDSADFILRISRRAGAAQTCAPYTLFARNG